MREQLPKGCGADPKIGRKSLKEAIGQVPVRTNFIDLPVAGPERSALRIWLFLKTGKILSKQVTSPVRNVNRNLLDSLPPRSAGLGDYSEMAAGLAKSFTRLLIHCFDKNRFKHRAILNTSCNDIKAKTPSTG